MDNATQEPRLRKLATPTTTDDESLETSTASETNDSWTLVTDKKNPKNTTFVYEEESNIEDLPKYEDLNLETSHSTPREENNLQPSPQHHGDTTSATDEFSDEVSIISDSESGDILTPNPYLREHLHSLNLKFTTGQGLDLGSLLQQQSQEEKTLQEEYEEEQTTPPNTPVQRSRNLRNMRTHLKTLDEIKKKIGDYKERIALEDRCVIDVGTLLKISFYLMVTSVIFVIYDNLYGFNWINIAGGSESSVKLLENKLNKMELQNNLMRAEIDLLSKQVNYLKSINSQKRNSPSNRLNNKDNDAEFNSKAYGNHKLPADNFKEKNIEEKRNIEELKDNETDYDSTPDIIEAVSELPYETVYTHEKREYVRYDENKSSDKKRKDFASNNGEKFKKRNGKKENLKQESKKYNSKERYDDNDKSEERKNFKKGSKERHNEMDNSKERNFKNKERNVNNSKERKQMKENKPKNNNNSNEKNNKNDKRDKNSYREYVKDSHSEEQPIHHRSQSAESFEDNNRNSGEWHEKLMQNREEARKEQQQRVKREKNWYLNRNDDREQWRSENIHTR